MERSLLEDVPDRGRVSFERLSLLEENQEEHYTLHKIILKGDAPERQFATLKTLTLPENAEGFIKEITIIKQLKHENVVSFIGALEDSKDRVYMLATEFTPRGSVCDYLKIDSRPLADDIFFSWLRQSSNAIQYIQTKDILHKDIRSRNFLISEGLPEGRLKLTGFSYAKVSVHTKTSIGRANTEEDNIPWQAPEVLKEDEVSRKSDIYSLCVFFWELITKKIPFRNQSRFQIITDVQAGKRPRIPKKCPEQLRQLLEKGWKGNPDDRLDIVEILLQVDQMEQQDDVHLHVPSRFPFLCCRH